MTVDYDKFIGWLSFEPDYNVVDLGAAINDILAGYEGKVFCTDVVYFSNAKDYFCVVFAREKVDYDEAAAYLKDQREIEETNEIQ